MVKQKIVFDLDDFSVMSINEFEYLLRMKEHYPKFKVSMFTIPYPFQISQRGIKEEDNAKFLQTIKEYDWIEVCPHGVSHIKGEGLAPKNKKDAKTQIDIFEKVFKDNEVEYAKVFKAPFWEGCSHLYTQLSKRGYTIAVNRDDVPEGNYKKYIYNWSIDEQKLPECDVIKAHGHIDLRSNNTIKNSYSNFMEQIDSDSEFMFISEYIKKYEKA
jgi:hypothetical protein